MRTLAGVLLALAALGCAEIEPVADDGTGGAGSGGAGGNPDAGSDAMLPPDGGPCWSDQKWCGACVDKTDPSHGCAQSTCDACLSPHATTKCETGKCAVKSCDPGFADCNQSAADGCETQTGADHANCGQCGSSCAASEVCLAGKCASNCGALENCSGSCVDTTSNTKHCGGCNQPCGATQTCQAGACVCPAGLSLCGGACVDTKTSKQHCGGCGNACSDPAGGLAACSAGKCSLACFAGSTLCGTQCVNTSTNVSHCGGCGKTCGSGEPCQSGACVATFAAATGFSDVQGKNGWSYLSSDGTPMSYVSANGWWKGAETYLLVTSVGGHPGANLDAVRRWTAPKAGSAKITGKAFDAHAGCGSDGVNISIRKGAGTLWQGVIAKDDGVGKTFDVTAAVAAGESVDFVLAKGIDDACDSTHFEPKVVLTYTP